MKLSEKIVRLTFFSALLILVVSGIITYKTTENLSNSSDELIRTYVVHIELEQIMSYLKDAETGRRGFLLTNDSVYLEPFLESREKINNSFAQLKVLTDKDAFQQDNLRELSILIDERLKRFRMADQYRIENELDTKAFDNQFLEGKKVMDEIRVKIDEMIKHEEKQLSIRKDELKQNVSLTPSLLVILVLLCIVFILLAYFKIVSDLEQLKKTNQALKIFKSSRNQSEKIGNNGTWIWDIEKNKFTYSDNLYRMLGEEPNAFEATIENYMSYVHPEDIDELNAAVEKMLQDKDLPFVNYRIIRKNGVVRHFKAFGKTLKLEGKRQLIGTTTDITDEVAYYRILKERNEDLLKNNEELSAFNHIASHDLQEPLRKIQTFLSRLVEKEQDNVSERSKIYIDKIQNAASRMRTLINDLLQFSRANKSEKVFEDANINELLESAKLNLYDAIESTNAKIKADKLPNMKVIPFQIQQLFENLMGNSIKYKRKDVAPIVTIKYNTVSSAEDERIEMEEKVNYHKLTFKDNGIGFDAAYNQKIFELFNRLHNKEEYTGTGIGLAICKKIVENHRGYIFATAQPNKGATFEVFIPA